MLSPVLGRRLAQLASSIPCNLFAWNILQRSIHSYPDPGIWMMKKRGGEEEAEISPQCLWTAALCHHICVRHFYGTSLIPLFNFNQVMGHSSLLQWHINTPNHIQQLLFLIATLQFFTLLLTSVASVGNLVSHFPTFLNTDAAFDFIFMD